MAERDTAFGRVLQTETAGLSESAVALRLPAHSKKSPLCMNPGESKRVDPPSPKATTRLVVGGLRKDNEGYAKISGLGNQRVMKVCEHW